MASSAPKPWFASVTIVSTLLAAIGGLIVVINSARPGTVPDEVTDAVNHPDAAANIAEWIGGLMWIVGFFGAIVGRLRASKPITKSVTGKVPMLLLCGMLTVGVVGSTAIMPGCASTEPIVAYDTANEVYIALAEVAIQARLDGFISTDTWNETYRPLFHRGDALLDAIEAAATLGDASETDRLLVLLAAVNAEIRTHLNP